VTDANQNSATGSLNFPACPPSVRITSSTETNISYADNYTSKTVTLTTVVSGGKQDIPILDGYGHFSKSQFNKPISNLANIPCSSLSSAVFIGLSVTDANK